MYSCGPSSPGTKPRTPVWLLPVLVALAGVGGAGEPRALPDIGGEEAQARLAAGNGRFVRGVSEHANISADRRAETAQAGQHPFATVLTCSDSRCPVERLFDQGIGEVFVVRVAGNVCAADEIGSIEYGVGHLQTPLLVMLGHTQCGAITAVVTGAEVSGSIPQLVAPIGPAVTRAKKECPDLKGKDLLPAAIRANIWQGIDDLLRNSPEVRERAESGQVKIVGALYHVEDGQVEWLGTHPEQERLLAYTGGPEPRPAKSTEDSASGHATKPDKPTGHATAAKTSSAPAGPTAREALARLKEGQARYVAGEAVHPNLTAERVAETAQSGQHPFVTIVGCSDSREPPELLFDQGVGDLFVVRVAGNVCNTDEIGTIEYGAGHLGTPLLVVLGHTSCGAVTAVATDAELHGSIPSLVAPIKPAVAAAKRAHPGLEGKALVPAAIQANVLQSMEDVLRRSAEIRELVRAGRLTVLGAVYDIEAGTVEWLGPHPREVALVGGGEQGQGAHAGTAPAGAAAAAKVDAKHKSADAGKSGAGHREAASTDAAVRTAADGHAKGSRQQEERNPTDARASGVSTPNTPPTKDRSSEAKEQSRSATSVGAATSSDSSYFRWVLIGSMGLVVCLTAIFGSQSNMFKKMKLGTKIGVGFGLLIVIAMGLGGTATWVMRSVETTANELAHANVPEVAVANQVERDARQTMFEARGYVYSEEKDFLQNARGHLADVKKDLQEAKSHASKFNDTALAQNAERAETAATEYEKLLDDTVAKTEAMEKDKGEMNEDAQRFMEVCTVFLDDQTRKLHAEIDAAVGAEKGAGEATETTITAEKLKERYHKTVLCNEVIDLGNAIRVGNWKAQATRDPKLFEEAHKKFDDVNKKLDELKAITRTELNLKQIEECRGAGQAYSETMTDYLKNWFAREELNKTRGAASAAVLDAAKMTAVAGMEDTAKSSQSAAGSLALASKTMVIGLALAAAIGVVLAVFITRSITKPVNRIIVNLTEGATQVTEASGQVSSSSQSLAEGASEQASSLEETSSALEQMAAMTRTNAENSKKALESAEQARRAADEGDKTMHQLNEAMSAINDSSAQVSKIIKVIEEIAFQTNLLALNAAVEAARAGEHGKGFAVVAEEVRNLAQRCATAAKDTTNLIEGSVQRAKQGADIATDVGKALSGIVSEASKVLELINGIARASDEQAQGVDQVNTAVSQMDKVTQQNAAGAEESASAAEELSAQAVAVNNVVAELAALVGAHQGNGATAGPPAHRASTRATPHSSFRHAALKRKDGRTTQGPAPSVASASEPAAAEGTELKDF